jgi:hypothetical protein
MCCRQCQRKCCNGKDRGAEHMMIVVRSAMPPQILWPLSNYRRRQKHRNQAVIRDGLPLPSHVREPVPFFLYTVCYNTSSIS